MRAPFSASGVEASCVVARRCGLDAVSRRPRIDARSTRAARRHRRRCGPSGRRCPALCEIGMMPRPADQSDRRLDADEAVGAGRTDDRSVGLGADADRREVGGDRRAGARARAARHCDRGRRGSSPGRRGRSSRWSNASIGSWPTRSGWSCRESPRRRRAAVRTDERRRAPASSLRARATRRSSSSGRRCRCCP